jgi:hypothetical protein
MTPRSGRATPNASQLLKSRRSVLWLILLIALLAPATYFIASPPSTSAIGGNPSLGIVISQVYGGAGCGTAGCSTYQNDFIELFNRSHTPISLNGLSVQYAAATGTAWQVTSLPNVTLQPGQYFLIAESFGANGVNPLPTPDATGTIAMSATAAKVALVNSTTALSGACPSNVTGTGAIIDFVGYGATANCSETANAPAPSTTTADIRNGGGNVDTDNNSTDFQALAPTPRNTASPFGTPSDVRLVSFKATRYDGGQVALEWRTGFEADNLGFNLYREAGGKRVRVNADMLAGTALMVGAGTRLMSGHPYVWLDDSLQNKNTRYWLEAVDLNGQSDWHGPFAVAPARPGDAPPRGRASLLSRLGQTGSQATSPVARTADVTGHHAAQVAIQSELAAGGAIKLTVTEEGWYRVTQPELRRAGLNPGVDPRNLQLFAEGQEQSILVRGEDDGRFDDGDTIEFYGMGLSTPATNARVYWLVAGNQSGRRIALEKGRAKRNTPSGFDYTVERRDRTIYFSSLKNGEAENFFGAVIARQPVDQALSLPRVDAASNEDGLLEVDLQGVTGVPHHVGVRFNGNELGEVGFYAVGQGSARFTVPRAQIREGRNTVTLTNAAGDGDVSLVDSIRMTYRRAYAADNNALRFTLQNKQRATIDGFTSPAVRVIDVSDPQAPREVRASVEPSAGGYRITVGTLNGGGHMMLAFADDQVKRPAAIAMDAASALKDKSQSADLIMVARRDFFSALAPLVEWREDHDLGVTLVDIEDVYDEFNFGERSPQAIKDFLAYAQSNWAKAPRFVMLVGDASFDPKNYLGQGDWDIVPTKLVDTIMMETASDDWLADFDGDGLPELAVGRLPARSADDVSLMVSKIITYDRRPPSDAVLFVSDSNDGIDFEQGMAELRSLVPGGKPVEEIVRGRLDDPATRGRIIGSLNRAPRIVNYFGHGSVDLWRGNLLTASDAPGLASSGGPSIFFSITCLNGYFHDPALESLAESLMLVEHGGAVAVWSSSSLCGANTQLLMDMEMFRQLFNSSSEPLTLGEAARRAKASIDDQDVRASYIVFGDPTMRLK